MVPPQARLNFGNRKNKSARLLRRLLAVEIGSTTDSTQQSDRVCFVARRMRYGSHVSVSQHGNTVCGMPFRPELIAGPSSDARHARVSDCGPKIPEKEVECAAVVRILGIETLPTNVEPEHAPRTRAVLVEAQPHSFDLHLSGVRVGRIAAASNKCLVYERELATLLAGRQQLSDCLSFTLALLRASQPRPNARLPYLIRLLASRGPRGPSIPSPHPVTVVFFSGKIGLASVRPWRHCVNHVHAKVCV